MKSLVYLCLFIVINSCTSLTEKEKTVKIIENPQLNLKDLKEKCQLIKTTWVNFPLLKMRVGPYWWKPELKKEILKEGGNTGLIATRPTSALEGMAVKIFNCKNTKTNKN